jgi:hypothetical protein
MSREQRAESIAKSKRESRNACQPTVLGKVGFFNSMPYALRSELQVGHG